jgi:hypothetical protein
MGRKESRTLKTIPIQRKTKIKGLRMIEASQPNSGTWPNMIAVSGAVAA